MDNWYLGDADLATLVDARVFHHGVVLLLRDNKGVSSRLDTFPFLRYVASVAKTECILEMVTQSSCSIISTLIIVSTEATHGTISSTVAIACYTGGWGVQNKCKANCTEMNRKVNNFSKLNNCTYHKHYKC